MMVQLVWKGVAQVPPYSASSANVQVNYELLGIPPDKVQIYAENAAGTGPANLVDESDVDPNNIGTVTSTDVQLEAGTYYTIYACPRTETDGMLDDQTDGEYWETYCQSGVVVTQVAPTSTKAGSPPIISMLTPEPATIENGNRIVVNWASDSVVYKIQISWSEDGEALPQHEDDFSDAGSIGGSWTAATDPGALYTFQANGGSGEGGDTWSGWGPTVKIVASPNVRSLKQFLNNSGIDPVNQHLSQLIPRRGSLKQFMKL